MFLVMVIQHCEVEKNGGYLLSIKQVFHTFHGLHLEKIFGKLAL